MQPKSHPRQLRPHLSGYFWKRSLSTQTANGVFGHLTRRFSKTVPRVEFFEMAGLSFSGGRKETEVTWTIQRMPCKGCYFISVLVWTGENDSNTLWWQKRTVGFCCMCKTKRETRPWTFPLQEIRTKQCFHLCEDEHGYRNVTKLKWNALRNLTHYLRKCNLTHILDKPTCRMSKSRPF